MHASLKLDDMQIETILDKLVPLIAKPEDYGFFRGLLRIKAEESSSGSFAAFVSTLLKANKWHSNEAAQEGDKAESQWSREKKR
jgi:hypothetical protein